MTVRVNALVGTEAGLYYVERPGEYYLDASEPLGLWHGQGAERLGLGGEVDEDAFLSLMAGLHPESGEQLGRRFGEKSVRGYDVTASAPKSVSVAFALGDERMRRAVLDAHDAAVASMVAWIEGHAHTRYRVFGDVMTFDAEGIVAATFRQHTSRALDPQLHTHVVIPNRVVSPDGRWLALDARTIMLDQRTLSAVYHAGLRAELTRSLGVEWEQPVHGIAEMRHVPAEVLEEFSSRTRAVQERIDEKLERFEQRLDRRPTPQERWRLEREAVTDSRPSKGSLPDAAELHAEWADRAIDAGHLPERVVAAALAEPVPPRWLDVAVEQEVVEGALAALAESQSTWRAAELVRELAAAVPRDVAVPSEQLVAWLDQVADRVVAERLLELSSPITGEPLRRDGRPITESVVERALTTPEILAQEERLLAWGDRRLARGGTDVAVDADDRLTGPQLEVASAVAGTRELVLVVGPAGTGKTAALTPAVEALRAEGRAVFGVAPSAAAAEVLATDAGLSADTLDKLLVEHRLNRPPDHRYDLPAGATVLVDEAAMVPTPRLAELAELADRRDWRLALVGDPLQFSAVGRSGMFGHLVQTSGAIELDKVHRFFHDWEREASLDLRRGNTDVLAVYDDHGRIHGGTRRSMETAIVQAWWEATRAGERASMMAPTNETVVALNQRAQAMRHEVIQLALGPTAEAGPYRVYVGDAVATRRNDRDLRTDCGLMVKNRDQWEVTAVHRDGGLSVTGRTGSLRLPAPYVADHVELAYAQTSHANQGRTVDRSFLLLDGPADCRSVYVPMTRGRHGNEAFVVLEGEETARDILAQALSRSWIDRPAVARRTELEYRQAPGEGRAAEATLSQDRLRELMGRLHEIDSTLSSAETRARMYGDQLDRATSRRDELVKTLSDAEARLDRARDVLDEFDRPLVRRLHRAEISHAQGDVNQAEGTIRDGGRELAKLGERIPQLQASIAEAEATLANRPTLDRERHGIRRELDRDLSARVPSLGADPPEHVIDRIGPRPSRAAVADLWDEAAARLNQHETAFPTNSDYRHLGFSHSWDDSPAAASHRAAERACERLDHSLGRGRSIEPRGLELGISL